MSIVGRGLPRAATAGRLAAFVLCGAVAACAGSGPAPTLPTPQPTAPSGPMVPAPPAVAPAPETAAIGGAIVDAAAARALARARVILTGPALTEPRVAITGEDGRFLFEALPPGAYTLSASRTGYVSQDFGERRGAAPAAIALDPGQRVQAADIRLRRAGVIAGQVLDEDGQPFAGAVVDALVTRLDAGQTTYVSLATASTDDRGEFRLVGLAEGEYFVSAFDPAFNAVGDSSGPLRYTPTYFPGVSTLEDARRVSVAAGQENPERIAFRLRIIRPARVSGSIATANQEQLLSGAVIMSPLSAEGLTTRPSQDVVILPDGSFEFRNVPPGRYQIRARGETASARTALFATFNLAVEGKDTRNVNMVLAPGASLSGRIVVEAIQSAKPLAFAGLRVRAPFLDGSSFGDALTGDVAPDGTFAVRGLMPGNHAVTLEGLTYPWVVKQVAYRGLDVTDVGLVAEAGQAFPDVVVTITDVASELTGRVQDAAGEPAGEATIVILPIARQFWTRTSRRLAVLRADAAGRYRVRGLPSGEYRAIAAADLDETDVFQPAMLQALSAHGVPLSITGAGRHTLDLTATALASIRTPSTR